MIDLNETVTCGQCGEEVSGHDAVPDPLVKWLCPPCAEEDE